MSDPEKSVLDKAESLARRVLEKLGAKVDGTLGAEGAKTLSAREVGELTSRVERVIETHLREDSAGVKRLAPNRYKVLFTYEEANRLNPQYIEALAGELEANIFEYVNNRRYETRGPIIVESGRDLFAKTPVIKAYFEGDPEVTAPAGLPLETASQTKQAIPAGAARVTLSTTEGRRYEIQLKPGGAPSVIGRGAGNALRIEDASISRLHCSIALKSTGQVVIADLGSSNGTMVNGRMLGQNETSTLAEGDEVQAGDLKLSVVAIILQTG
jgi:hypothetical protein